MIGITNQQYVEAMGASGSLAGAADMIFGAVQRLTEVPERFRPEMRKAMALPIDDGMVEALHKLADRIALDADIASERGE